MNPVAGDLLALFTIGVTAASSASSAAERSSVAAGAPCPFQPLQYYLVCYAPQQKAIAQRRFAARPLDPSHIVKALSGKPLTAVVDGQHFVGPTLRTSRKVTWLEYDFGPVPTWNIPTTTPMPTLALTPGVRPANWTSVVEFPPPFIKLNGMQVIKYAWGGARWKLDEELLVHHLLSLSIFSNENRATVMAIGRALMKKDKHG